MSYRSRSARRLVRKSKHNFLATIIIAAFLLFATFNYLLPNLIQGLGFIKGSLNTAEKKENVAEGASVAPPVLNIPYEATNSSKIKIAGYSAPNSKVKIYLDEFLQAEVNVKSDGTFTTDEIALNLGTNNIFGKTVDDKDRESLPSKVVKVILDTEPPSLEISEPQESETIKDKKIKIVGKTEAGSDVEINGAKTIVQSDGSFASAISLNEGQNDISIKAQDKAGNSTEIVRKVTFSP